MIDWQGKVVTPCVATFGQPATIVWNGQTIPLANGGVFDEAYTETDVSDGLPVTTTSPCLGVCVGDVNLGGQPLSALQDARVTVFASPFPGGAPAVDTEYVVREARADGHGWARLMLNLAPVAGDEPQGGGQDA